MIYFLVVTTFGITYVGKICKITNKFSIRLISHHYNNHQTIYNSNTSHNNNSQFPITTLYDRAYVEDNTNWYIEYQTKDFKELQDYILTRKTLEDL